MVDPALVESVPSLAALPESPKRALAGEFDEVDVSADGLIVSHATSHMSSSQLSRGRPGSSRTAKTVAKLGPGDLCGEIGLLLTGRRTAAIVAETPMRMLALFDQPFRRLTSEHPEFAELIRSQSRGRFTRPETV